MALKLLLRCTESGPDNMQTRSSVLYHFHEISFPDVHTFPIQCVIMYYLYKEGTNLLANKRVLL